MKPISSRSKRGVLLCALLVLPFGAGLRAAGDKLTVDLKPSDAAEPANAGVSIWTQNVTGFRKEHGAVGGYTKRWDLSAMPHYALFYVSPASMGPELKELALQAYEGGPYVVRSLESIHDHTYPLYHESFFYFNREPGQPIDPKVAEFLHFILSQEGQDCIQRDGKYMPLTPDIVNAQLKKLE